MPIYVIERQYAEQMRLADLGAGALYAQSLDEGMHWLYSFLSADRRKSYCLYEAPSYETIRAAVRRAGLPEAVIVEVDRVDPAGVDSGPGAGCP